MLFDLTGRRHDTMKTLKIDLTGFGVMGEDSKVLHPEENPHVVSNLFGRELIHSGRAVEHDPANPIKPARKEEVKPPAGVQNRDPKVTSRDPR
jgi:hypothetical protein